MLHGGKALGLVDAQDAVLVKAGGACVKADLLILQQHPQRQIARRSPAGAPAEASTARTQPGSGPAAGGASARRAAGSSSNRRARRFIPQPTRWRPPSPAGRRGGLGAVSFWHRVTGVNLAHARP
jgi:hypothetical protein